MLVTEDLEAITTVLQQTFGWPDRVIKLLLSKIRKHDSTKDGNSVSFCKFAESINHYVAIVESLHEPEPL